MIRPVPVAVDDGLPASVDNAELFTFRQEDIKVTSFFCSVLCVDYTQVWGTFTMAPNRIFVTQFRTQHRLSAELHDKQILRQ